MELHTRFEQKYVPEPNSGCWLWLGAINRGGYGVMRGIGKNELAHRVSYTVYKDVIPKYLELDHLCRIRCCVNPDHLEPVTKKVNSERGIAGEKARQRQLAKMFCPKGHPYSVENTYIRPDKFGRGCKACRNFSAMIYKQRKREKVRS